MQMEELAIEDLLIAEADVLHMSWFLLHPRYCTYHHNKLAIFSMP